MRKSKGWSSIPSFSCFYLIAYFCSLNMVLCNISEHKYIQNDQATTEEQTQMKQLKQLPSRSLRRSPRTIPRVLRMDFSLLCVGGFYAH